MFFEKPIDGWQQATGRKAMIERIIRIIQGFCPKSGRYGMEKGVNGWWIGGSIQAQFSDSAVGQDHIGITPQGLEVVPCETFTRFLRHKQRPPALFEILHIPNRNVLLTLEALIQRSDELGERPQPREPWIMNGQLQEVTGGGNGAKGLLISHALGFEQRLVQSQKGCSQLS